MDLLGLLTRPEGKTLEFKRDLSAPTGVLKTLVAFANTAGGTVIIGVEDRTGSVRGVPHPIDLEERLANLVTDSISPRLLPEIEVLPWRDTHLVAVQVHPTAMGPFFLTRDGLDGGVYVRVGSTNRRADAEMIEELRRAARGQSHDETPLPDLSSEAIDFRAASESFLPVRRLRRSDLETLRILTDYQGRKVPTVGGLLLFGRDRESYFPDAWIQVGKFADSDKTHLVDHAQFKSSLVTGIQATIDFIEKHSLHGATIGRVRRIEQWSLPPVAVREAVINAVAHADYAQRGAPIRVSLFDDRLEIENPGLLPLGLTVEDLERGISKLRNRVIGRVFNALGLIEQWGSGIQRMTAACRDAGLPAPQLQEIATRFRVTLFTTKVTTPSLDDKDQSIVDVLANGRGMLTSEVAKVIALTPRATRTRLARLIGSGIVREVGSGLRDPKRKYYLAT